MCRFSVGYNFDPALLPALVEVNRIAGASGTVSEVYGAIRMGTVRSARPAHKVPDLGWGDLARHVETAGHYGLAFNYLLNSQRLASEEGLRTQIRRLLDCGVTMITVGTPAMARIARALCPALTIILSLTHRVRERADLNEAIAAGIQAVYLDAVTVNRDFKLLRSLLGAPGVEKRLYANVSCLSACPVIDAHYRAFDLDDEAAAARSNARFFRGCSWVKAHSPVQWLQMPWIRPEDIGRYQAEGVTHFKLSDRMAPTETLINIARAYVTGRSPANLFSIIERDGAKFSSVWEGSGEHVTPFVASSMIPDSFLDHFRAGVCNSQDSACAYCNAVADRSVRFGGVWPKGRNDPAFVAKLPRALVRRVEANP